MEIEFPVEFVVQGTPLSLQSRNAATRDEWKLRITTAGDLVLPAPHFASQKRVAVTIYYLPAEEIQADLDNILKPILDALQGSVLVNDRQVDRIVVQRFELESTPDLGASGSETLHRAWSEDRPLLYIRITDVVEQENL
jgi:crossover junction endodeoxyribonuclease RusA